MSLYQVQLRVIARGEGATSRPREMLFGTSFPGDTQRDTDADTGHGC